jgi:CBS domain-containing protein
MEGKESRAIFIALFFLMLGIAIIIILKLLLKVTSDSITIALLILPLLVYLISSGRISEFKGPGGIEAKFSKTASEHVMIASENIEPSIEEMNAVEKESLQVLEKKRTEIRENEPIIMLMSLGEQDYYNREATLKYIEVLSQFRNFKFVVFRDKSKEVVGYMPVWAVKGLLSNPELGHYFIQVINQDNRPEFLRFPGIIKRKDAVTVKTTNAEALKAMETQNLEALVVVDDKGKLKGIVEREKILSKMMLSLIK